MKPRNLIPEIIFLAGVAFYLCNYNPHIKDATNGKQFKHTQIPLGESFEIINDEIKRLTEMNDMLLVSHEVTFSDLNRNILRGKPF